MPLSTTHLLNLTCTMSCNVNFTSVMHMHMWPYYILITYLVILTYSFEMAAIWYFSFDFGLLSIDIKLISDIYEHFLEINILFTSHSCASTHGPLRLSCVFLANYVPKYQMSSGPYVPIFDGKFVITMQTVVLLKVYTR